MASRMRRPEDVRLTLPSDEDWILVKKHLTAGEHRRAQVRVIKSLSPGEKMELDPEQVGLTLVLAYMLDWSILDAEGRPIIIRDQSEDKLRAALTDLDPEKFAEIVDAVTAHDAAMVTERAQEKKRRESPSSAISGFVV